MTSPSDKHDHCCGGGCHSADASTGAPDETRRDFILLAGGAMGAVGAASAAWPFIHSMNPAADTLALSTTEVDLADLQEGQSKTVMWRGKPVFIRRRTKAEVDEARAVKDSDMKDPQSDAARVAQSKFGDKEMPEYLVMIGVCTHLGCVPLGQKPTDPHGEFDGWFCPCHGSQYDSSGRIRKGPAPKNLEIPPYKFVDATRIKIG